MAEHPGIGHRRTELGADPQTRFWSVGPSLIAYREAGDGVEVLFVERGAMDWPRLLGD